MRNKNINEAKRRMTAKARERASRIANNVDFNSVWTYIPLLVFYSFIFFASICYKYQLDGNDNDNDSDVNDDVEIESTTQPALVVISLALFALWIKVVRNDSLMRKYVNVKKLCMEMDLVTAFHLITVWFAYGLIAKDLVRDIPPAASLVATILAVFGLASTYSKLVYSKNLVRKAIYLLVFSLLLFLPSFEAVAVHMWWVSVWIKITLFFAMYILTEAESQSFNIPPGDIYSRSSERKIMQAGWILWAGQYFVLLPVVAIQILYLSVLMQQRQSRLAKKTDGAPIPSLTTSSHAAKITENGQQPKVNTDAEAMVQTKGINGPSVTIDIEQGMVNTENKQNVSGTQYIEDGDESEYSDDYYYHTSDYDEDDIEYDVYDVADDKYDTGGGITVIGDGQYSQISSDSKYDDDDDFDFDSQSDVVAPRSDPGSDPARRMKLHNQRSLPPRNSSTPSPPPPPHHPPRFVSTGVNGTGIHVKTLPPGSAVPPGAIPIDENQLSKFFPLNQLPGAKPVSNPPKPKIKPTLHIPNRKPRSRLGAKVRGK